MLMKRGRIGLHPAMALNEQTHRSRPQGSEAGAFSALGYGVAGAEVEGCPT